MNAQIDVARFARSATRHWARLWLLAFLGCAALPREGRSLGQETYVEDAASENSFALAAAGRVASVYVDQKDWPGVIRAADDLQADLRRVTGLTASRSLAANTVIVGTLGKSPVIDRLVASGKINPKAITGKWESFFIQVVADPMPGVTRAAVIVGSDKRGTIYGIYDLSEQIGVSPWYWWADVTPARRDALFIKAGKFQQGEPSVKYRGIFLNDESPDLSNWVKANYGDRDGVADYGHEFYAHIFEAILRMKGNYLWPAMWNNAFNEDDPENPRLADEYGIVMGTSHQEPMLRAQKEWDRRHPKTNWNYATAPADLRSFWHEGISRNKDYESILTIGLRGANDTPMIRGGDSGQAIDLLKQIIGDQRTMIAEVYDRPASQVAQLWCPYKEVLDYYDADPTMRAPDDVTMLWTDDNWGNLRRLPDATERARRGGSGIYYHFDYVGGPRNYKWINANPLPKIWDQMNLAKTWGADRIWIVNAGHFKGYEIPIEYFLQLGWNSNRWTGENIDEYTQLWATREFGPAHAAEIADLVTRYTRYNGRRKPELLEPGTYSVADYHEADTAVADFKAIVARAKTIMAQLPKEKQDAFYELVLFPALASEQVDELYVDAGKNALYTAQGRASANDFADAAKTMFGADGSLMSNFNQAFASGKWNHFMDQVHLGYAGWQDPEKSAPPKTKNIPLPGSAKLGVALEGSSQAWPGGADAAALPRFDALNRQTRIIEVFNRGQGSLDFTASASAPWIQLSAARGAVEKDYRLGVRIDWSKAPADLATGSVSIKGLGEQVTVKIEAWRPADVTRETLQGFAEDAGVVSIEAEHFTKSTRTDSASWERIADYGRTLSGMRATAPPDTSAGAPGAALPCLEYRLYLADAGPAKATFIVGPTLNFVAGRGLRMAVSIDDAPPAEVEIVAADYKVSDKSEWGQAVADNAHLVHADLAIPTPGYHTLKVWMMDPAVVLEKIVLDLGGETESYLGPPESYRGTAAAP